MISYIIVTETPYFALVDSEGNFEIANVPAGKWKLKVWHERLKTKSLKKTFDVIVEDGKEATISIKP